MSFETHTHQGLTWLTSAVLEDAGVHHGFTTRPGGVSPAPWDSLNLGPTRGDDPANVRENYRRICDALHMDVEKVVLSRQVHEAQVRHVTLADAGKGLWRERDYESADALITNVPGLPLVIFSADCNIILLHDPVHRAIGAVHAGWRGVALGLVRKTVEEMHAAYGTQAHDLHCAIGPAIGQCCFETDDDVPQALREALGEAADPYMERRGPKWHIDLKAINALWLQLAGVPEDRIDICPHCTACQPSLYWSHRKMGQARGVQTAMISLDEGRKPQ